MTYDLAVWEGDRPSSDTEAGDIHETLYKRYNESDEDIAPTPSITKFVETLLQRWPDLGENDDFEPPWAAGPLINEANGPYIYFAMSWSWAAEAAAYAAQVATGLGLVCYDPQDDRLLN